MAWDTLLIATENRFKAKVDIDSIPTYYANLTPAQPAVDTGSGLFRSIDWQVAEPFGGLRGREETIAQMVVMIHSAPNIGAKAAIAHAQSIRSTLDADYKANPESGIHYEAGSLDIIGKNKAGYYQVNYVLRLRFEELVA